MKEKWIEKNVAGLSVEPNLLDYVSEYEKVSWDDVASEFDGLPSCGLDIAYESVDRHANGALANNTALLWLGQNGEKETYTFSDIKKEAEKFAKVLKTLDLFSGDRIFTLSSRIPQLYISIMGIIKNKNVLCPLFTEFEPEPILQRMQRGNAKVLLTTKKLFHKKIVPILSKLAALEYIILLDAEEDEGEYILSYSRLMQETSDIFNMAYHDSEDMPLSHFISAST